MAKQVSEILVKLGIQGAEGLDKLKSSFRELEKAIGPSAETIERARESIIAFGKEGKNTEQLIKGQIEALRGLQSQTERGSAAWAELAGDIERFRQASRKTDGEIQVLRQSILSVVSGADQSQKSLREYIGDLSRLRSQATITGGTFQELSRDIAALTGRLQEAEQQTEKTGRAFGRVLGQALASTSAGLRRQLDGIKELINEQRGIVDSIDLLSKKERELADNQEKRAAAQERLNRALVQQRQLQYAESIRAGRETARVGAAAFNDPNFPSFERIRQQYGDLPDTTAGLNQELSELSERLLNTTRGSNLYVETANRMAEIQRELRTELTGTAEAFRKLGIAQNGVERRAGKLADIQEYYRTQGPMAPGVGGYRDPATGAMIMGGARTPGRIRVEESAYPTPIGPQPFPEAGRRAQESIQRSLDDVNRIYEDARIRRIELQSKYDQIHIDKLLDGLELEGRVRDKGFRDELAAFDRQLEARDRKRRSRLTAGQAVQSAGAIISGGIFGGPEGFLGGLGGFAAGLAIPGLGPVGGAFAGAAAGAQVGAFRQQLGAAAEYAAEIRKLQLALQGVVYSFDDYRSALIAIESASEQFNIPIQQGTQQFTKLSAAVIGSGGTIKDAENTFKGLSASVLATGGSINDINGALVAAAQVFSKGKVSAEELRGQIGERLAGAFALFAESSEVSTQQLDKNLQNGEVTLAQFVKFTEFALQKYGRTAQIIADSPEQAGARLDRALKDLQKNVGNALGPAGAAFQDFAAKSIRGLDRLINKLIELKAIQPGAGYFQEQVLGRQMSVGQLEQQLLQAGARESELRARAAGVGLGFIADLLPEIAAATKEAKILEEALVKIRQIEKETNKEKKQRIEDEQQAEKEKLGAKYLQAIEQREEALGAARLQREEEIAQIRKNAIEQAFQIERQLADERRNIERDMERVRREMQYGSDEISRLQRLAQGEDPAVIEAERKAAEISRQATESRIKIEEDLLDKELEQQRTIADFQKNTAKQIADANQAYAKRVGEIQKDFAKESAKIIEEGSGKAARKITLAAQIISQVLQRSALNQQRAQYGLQAIGEPTGFRGGQPVYGQMSGDEVPAQIKRIDMNLEQLLKKLQQSRLPQSGTPSSRISATGIGEQFIGMLGAESGYEDVAGLLPLPIEKMRQQAARPLRLFWESVQDMTEGLYAVSKKEAQRYMQQQKGFNLPAAREKVIQNLQRFESYRAGDKWDPTEAQWKERENRWNPNPRSKPSAASLETLSGVARQISGDAFKTLNNMGASLYGLLGDISDYLSEGQLEILRKGIKEQLGKGVSPSAIKTQVTGGNINTGRANIRAAVQSLVDELSTPNAGQGLTKPFESKFFDRLQNQPIIDPGIESQFEGAMLPGRGFDISRMTRMLGNVATASGSMMGYFPAIAQNIQGAAPTTQLRQQSAQQQIQQVDQQALIQSYQVLSEIKTSSQQTLDNYRLQNREIDLQIQALTKGVEPAIAEEFSGLQANYELQQKQLEIRRQALIDQGQNAKAVNQAYMDESQALAKIHEQNQAAIIQYQEKRKVLEQIQNVSSILESNLTSAISNSVEVLVTGAGTVKQVLADMLKSIGQAFIQMAAQIIAKQLAMVALGSILKALGIAAPSGGSTTGFGSSYFNPVTGLGNAGPNFGLAKGGVVDQNGIQPFAMGGIVTRPTFFKYAKGGEMQNGLMGEAGPEAIMPLKRGADGKLGVAAKLDGAMGRYRRSPGAVGGPAGGGATTEAAAGGMATMEPIDVRYSVERINNVEYVTADQFRAGMAQAAQQGAIQGERRAMRTLTNSAAARGRLGI